MGQGLRFLALSVSALSMCVAPGAHAQWASARAAQSSSVLALGYQDDGAYWRQQVRVASPSRHARWNAAPPGAVRVYHRRFDARWNWRSAPRHRVVYTYYRGDLWFLDPTTGWAYSVDRYGIVYTADPNRGWVYSLGPLTRWTADLLYFFDLYRFDRGYWYCSDYDYFVDLWEGYPRYDYYTYDTAYSTLWDWEPYFNSPTFISYSNRFSTVWVGQVRSHYRYMERHPYYRREVIDSIGLPAMQAAPPRMVSPRAVATTAYWEARDLAGAGMAPPPRGRDTGRGQAGFEAGTIVDANAQPSRVVEPGTPAPGFNAPFPDGTYGFGVSPGAGGDAARGRDGGSRGESSTTGREASLPPSGPMEPPAEVDTPRERGRDGGRPSGELAPESNPGTSIDTPPQFEAPAYTPPSDSPRNEAPAPTEAPRENDFGRGRDDERYQVPVDAARYDLPQGSPPPVPPREERGWEASPEQSRQDAPPEEVRYEAPREEPRYEAPREEVREEPRFEEPREEVREEPQYEAPREEPRYEEPREEVREEPRYEEPREEPREEPKEEPQDDRPEE